MEAQRLHRLPTAKKVKEDNTKEEGRERKTAEEAEVVYVFFFFLHKLSRT